MKKGLLWIVFVLITSFILFCLVLWALESQGLETSLMIKFVIYFGINMAMGLGVGLMALSYYSDRSGHDTDVFTYSIDEEVSVKADKENSNTK